MAGSGELEALESIDVVRHFLQKCRYFGAVSLLDNTPTTGKLFRRSRCRGVLRHWLYRFLIFSHENVAEDMKSELVIQTSSRFRENTCGLYDGRKKKGKKMESRKFGFLYLRKESNKSRI